MPQNSDSPLSSKRVAILFDNLGPYHVARLKAAGTVCDLLAVEFGSSSAEYEWDASDATGLRRVLINPEGSEAQLTTESFKKGLFETLENFAPEVVFIPGWNSRGALLTLRWCGMHNIPAVVMSESTEGDHVRHMLKEWVKGTILNLFTCALAGGAPQRSYLEKMGFPPDRIFLGYDAVDNGYFRLQSDRVRMKEEEMRGMLSLPPVYFLASARFIEKKNLRRLLEAYAIYRKKVSARSDARPSCSESGEGGDVEAAGDPRPTKFPQSGPWDLVLLGDGPLRSELETLRSELGLEDSLHMPGFKQYGELPAYYGLSACFVHPSSTEPWGLVVNEAMASGLPVLVSNRCGCAADLVRNGVNGWTFDPGDEEQISDLMVKISSNENQRRVMGTKSREIIANWGPERFASGVSYAIKTALKTRRKHGAFLSTLMLKAFLPR